MNYPTWSDLENRWSGVCPRCGMQSFFENRFTLPSPKTRIYAEVIFCPGGHGIFIEYPTRTDGKKIATSCSPIEYSRDVPAWLPDNYKKVYEELLVVKNQKNNRSVAALCGILLEAQVNDLLKNPGEKKKSLFDRLEILFDKGVIDKDQFSNATITRITRNELLHPKDILKDVPDEEAERIFEEVTNFFEKFYRFRSSRALPAGSENIEISDAATTDSS